LPQPCRRSRATEGPAAVCRCLVRSRRCGCCYRMPGLAVTGTGPTAGAPAAVAVAVVATAVAGRLVRSSRCRHRHCRDAQRCSMRAAMRKPSGFISRTHCGPEGGFSTGWESCRGTDRGRSTPRRVGPTVTAGEAERLSTGDNLETQFGGKSSLSTRICHSRLLPFQRR
jgi:hypothetical protein